MKESQMEVVDLLMHTFYACTGVFILLEFGLLFGYWDALEEEFPQVVTIELVIHTLYTLWCIIGLFTSTWPFFVGLWVASLWDMEDEDTSSTICIILLISVIVFKYHF